MIQKTLCDKHKYLSIQNGTFGMHLRLFRLAQDELHAVQVGHLQHGAKLGPGVVHLDLLHVGLLHQLQHRVQVQDSQVGVVRLFLKSQCDDDGGGDGGGGDGGDDGDDDDDGDDNDGHDDGGDGDDDDDDDK
jgi:hypothetical protein